MRVSLQSQKTAMRDIYEVFTGLLVEPRGNVPGDRNARYYGTDRSSTHGLAVGPIATAKDFAVGTATDKPNALRNEQQVQLLEASQRHIGDASRNVNAEQDPHRE